VLLLHYLLLELLNNLLRPFQLDLESFDLLSRKVSLIAVLLRRLVTPLGKSGESIECHSHEISDEEEG